MEQLVMCLVTCPETLSELDSLAAMFRPQPEMGLVDQV
jgi:hypothetical protein